MKLCTTARYVAALNVDHSLAVLVSETDQAVPDEWCDCAPCKHLPVTLQAVLATA